ncbi:MAG: hypothetical protein HYU99_10980 [Deltaproteobacteria bacterium]|nr:hypothetical protein [Deltaproteobacteria bacterium]
MLLLFRVTFAQEGPIGPVGPDTGPPTSTSDTGSKKPPVDLPYKPSGDIKPPRTSSGNEPDIETPAQPPREIPYIPSKSPEPLGAPDPEF